MAVANFHFVSGLHRAEAHHASATQADQPNLPSAQAKDGCPVCRDFANGLKIKHDLNDTCAVLELERQLMGNIEIDAAFKEHIFHLKAPGDGTRRETEIVQGVASKLRVDVETLQQDKGIMKGENIRLQSYNDSITKQINSVESDLATSEG